MSDVGADLQALREMVAEAEDRLVKKDSYHPLIRYLFIRNEKEMGKAWQKQLRKFSKNPEAGGNVKGAMESCDALSRYLFALKEELGENPLPKEVVGVVDVSGGFPDDGLDLPF